MELIFDPHFQGRRTVDRLTGEAGFRAKAFFPKPLGLHRVFRETSRRLIGPHIGITWRKRMDAIR